MATDANSGQQSRNQSDVQENLDRDTAAHTYNVQPDSIAEAGGGNTSPNMSDRGQDTPGPKPA